MSTRSINRENSITPTYDFNLPQPDITATRLLAAFTSFTTDKGPETGLIATSQAFRFKGRYSNASQIQDLVKARAIFFKHIYAFMGTTNSQSIDLNDPNKATLGKKLFEESFEISNKQRAKAIKFAAEILFPDLLKKLSPSKEVSPRRQDSCCSTT